MKIPGLDGLSGIGRSLVASEFDEVMPGASSLFMGGTGDRSRRRAPRATTLNEMERKLRQGFLAEGKHKLANMVGTTDFDMWINQESGWDPNIVSEANNQGQRNGGLFQFWYGHDFTDPYEDPNSFNMGIRKQAREAARQFDLKARDVERYAQQIRDGTYKGWG